jgi:hypothetical protein
MHKQFFRLCGGETKEFAITLQDEALTLEVVDEAEWVVGIVQRPQDILLPAAAVLMCHFISFVLSIYIHMLSVSSILTTGLEEQSVTSFIMPLQVQLLIQCNKNYFVSFCYKTHNIHLSYKL